MIALPSLSSLTAAADLVHKVFPPTPQIRWPLLCERIGAEVWVKHENHTPIGAFKVRGGLVYMAELKRTKPNLERIVAATRGNHGQSIAFAGALAGLKSTIVVPHGNASDKNAAIRAFGAELIEFGEDFQDAFEHAAHLATENGMHMVPSFNATLLRGVATYSLELFQAVSDLDAMYVPIGLGSGICGAIAARDALGLKTEIIGVVASAAPAYAVSLAANQAIAVNVSQTIADGMACRVPDPEALELIRKGASRVITVNEDEIRAAIRYLFSDTHNVAEGAGAAALAGLIQERKLMRGRRVAIILTGSNIDRDVFVRILMPEARL